MKVWGLGHILQPSELYKRVPSRLGHSSLEGSKPIRLLLTVIGLLLISALALVKALYVALPALDCWERY